MRSPLIAPGPESPSGAAARPTPCPCCAAYCVGTRSALPVGARPPSSRAFHHGPDQWPCLRGEPALHGRERRSKGGSRVGELSQARAGRCVRPCLCGAASNRRPHLRARVPVEPPGTCTREEVNSVGRARGRSVAQRVPLVCRTFGLACGESAYGVTHAACPFQAHSCC